MQLYFAAPEADWLG